MSDPATEQKPDASCGCGCSTRGHYADRHGDAGDLYAEIRDTLARIRRLSPGDPS